MDEMVTGKKIAFAGVCHGFQELNLCALSFLRVPSMLETAHGHVFDVISHCYIPKYSHAIFPLRLSVQVGLSGTSNSQVLAIIEQNLA